MEKKLSLYELKKELDRIADVMGKKDFEIVTNCEKVLITSDTKEITLWTTESELLIRTQMALLTEQEENIELKKRLKVRACRLGG